MVEYQCRICLDNCNRSEVIAPCKCSGSSKWVHRECLNKWRSINSSSNNNTINAFSHCTVCLQQYQLINNSHDSNKRNMRFYCLVAYDYFIILLICTTIITIVTLLLYLIDYHSHGIVKLLRMGRYPLLCYTLLSVLLLLALLGLIFITCPKLLFSDNTLYITDMCVCDCSYPLWYTPYNTNAGCECCCCCPDEVCCHPGHVGTIDCCYCCEGAAASGDCSGIGAAGGEMCLVFLFIAVVVFAVIGIFVLIAWGAVLAQSILRRHWHVLHKYSLAEEYMVMDLASESDIEEGLHKDIITDSSNNGAMEDEQSRLLSSSADKGVELVPHSSTLPSAVVIDRSVDNSNNNSNSNPEYNQGALTSEQYEELKRYGLL